PERLGPGDWRQQRDSAAEKARFFAVTDLADILDVRTREQLADFGFEIVAIDCVDFGGDLQRHPSALGYPDRLINSLLRRDAAEKCKVGRLNGLWHQKLLRQAMMNGAYPAGAGNGPSLGVRNRDHRDRWERGEEVQQIEIVSPLPNLLKHGHMQRIRIVDRAI